MNESERSELERLKQRQVRLGHEMELLAVQLKRLETALNREAAAAPVRIPAPPPREIQPESPPLPAQTEIAPEIPVAIAPAAVTPPLPPRIDARPIVVPPIISKVPDSGFIQVTAEPTAAFRKPAVPGDSKTAEPTRFGSAPPPGATPPPLRRTSEVSGKSSFEMRLGTFWLVRIGIVMLLTGLVFFANYAYQHLIGKLGPAGKVSLLYLASGALLGAGAWWQRQSVKESLKNYAQVLFAGGLAAVYFTTYVAHHIPNLRVIQSPILDGVLLLAWAGFMAWIADRKQSEVLALFAVGLAYYTSAITRVGDFTLYSNLVLTLAAVLFLVRNRWAALSFASLVATYASYAFWRFFHGGEWRWATAEEGLWFGIYFLAAYWMLFTAAVFLSKHDNLAGGRRASFLTFNNGAFFSLFLLTLLQVHHGGFWKFSLGYGAVLLALSAGSRRVFADEPIVRNSYLTQGLLLVTVGLVAKYLDTSRTLALVLGAESVVLLVLGTQRRSLILQAGAYLTAAMSVGWGIDGVEKNDRPGLYLGAALGVLMVFNAIWSARKTPLANPVTLRPTPAYFTVLALVIGVFTTWANTAAESFPLVLAIEAGLLTVSIYWLRVPEIPLLGQGCLALALLAWQVQALSPGTALPWWNPLVLVGVTLGLSHWWQRQKVLVSGSQVSAGWQLLYALGVVGLLYTWLHPKVDAGSWLALVSLLGVGVTAYGVGTRAWWLAACGQILVLIGGAQFALQLLQGKPDWYLPLVPLAALGLLSYSTVKWFERKPDDGGPLREPLLQIALLYRWSALVMSVWWVCEYIPERERGWVLLALGFAVFLLAGWRNNREALLFGAGFTLCGLALLWLPAHWGRLVYAPNAIALLALLTQQQIARRQPARYALPEGAHTAVIITGCLSVWLFVSRWVLQSASGFYLTASWSVLALGLFACGIVLRERVYRWVGLAILAAALGRVVLFDVWKLETPYRVLSFMALGLVLLVLGFIYNKYQEKIRQWL